MNKYFQALPIEWELVQLKAIGKLGAGAFVIFDRPIGKYAHGNVRRGVWHDTIDEIKMRRPYLVGMINSISFPYSLWSERKPWILSSGLQVGYDPETLGDLIYVG